MTRKMVSFPDELVEKIISMMPFPSFFKARVLSKTWCSKVAAPEVEEDSSASSFQKQVASCVNNWASYCPALLNGDRFIAFDKQSRRWRKMKLLWYLPENFSRLRVKVQGCLLCGYVIPEAGNSDCNLYVTNVLTRTYKLLPRRPNMRHGITEHLSQDSDSYQVILFTEAYDSRPEVPNYDAQIYNSSLDSWTCTKFATDDYLCLSPPSGYLDGILYLATEKFLMTKQIVILALNLKEGTFSRFNLEFSLEGSSASVSLVVCGGDVMAIMSRATPPTEEILSLGDDSDWGTVPKQSILVTRFQWKTSELEEVARGPPENMNHAVFNHPVSDGDCIYFAGRASSPVVEYDLGKHEWGTLPAAIGPYEDGGVFFGYRRDAFNFQPGLNLFVVV